MKYSKFLKLFLNYQFNYFYSNYQSMQLFPDYLLKADLYLIILNFYFIKILNFKNLIKK
jgi:hypothetical protein